jgi:hypothetical protein
MHRFSLLEGGWGGGGGDAARAASSLLGRPCSSGPACECEAEPLTSPSLAPSDLFCFWLGILTGFVTKDARMRQADEPKLRHLAAAERGTG